MRIKRSQVLEKEYDKSILNHKKCITKKKGTNVKHKCIRLAISPEIGKIIRGMDIDLIIDAPLIKEITISLDVPAKKYQKISPDNK